MPVVTHPRQPISVELEECFECWNPILVHRLRNTPPTVAVVRELPCPHCGRPLEFDWSVVGVEKIPMTARRRRLTNLDRRLFVAKVDAEVRERERLRRLRESG
jgi:hypothetical protein